MALYFNISSGLNDDLYGKSIAPIISFLEREDEAAVKNQIFPKIFKEIKSTHYAEKYASMTSMTDFEPTVEGGSIPNMDMQEGFGKIIENVQWTGKFTITKRAMRESILTDLTQRPQQFIDSYHRAKEKFAARLIGEAIKKQSSVKINGITFDLKTADNSNLFATNHPSAVARKTHTQSNMFSNAFSNENLMLAATAMQQFADDQGEVLSIAPDTIVIPNIGSLKAEVFAALGADKSPDTANNGFNYNYGMWNVIVWPMLNQFITGGTKPWLLLDSKYIQRTNALVFQNRQDLEVDVCMSSNNKDTEWVGDAVFSAGFVNWRGIAAGGIADGTALS